MNCKLITTVSTTDNPGLHKLEASLKRFNYDYLIIHDPNIEWSWSGWHSLYRWCVNESSGYTHFIYTDGFDTLALGGMDEVLSAYKHHDSFIYSTEKQAYPITEWAKDYPQTEDWQRWKYVNGGQFLAPIDLFIKMYQQIDLTINSQHWATKKFIWDNSDGLIKLDLNCEIFQSIAFKDDTEFSIEGERLINNYTKTKPVFAHGNGHSEFGWVYDILK